MMIYVMSDIHGHKSRFEDILTQINLKTEDKLYILGDVIDRNPDGIEILQTVMNSPNIKMSLGNHELLMSDALDYILEDEDTCTLYSVFARQTWYENGGEITHECFNRLSSDEQKEILRFLKHLPFNFVITVNGKKHILTHSGIESNYCGENLYLYNSAAEYVTWARDTESVNLSQNETLIFGHTPTSYFQQVKPLSIWHGENRCGIDCGCAFENGRLACLRLDDMKEFYSKN